MCLLQRDNQSVQLCSEGEVGSVGRRAMRSVASHGEEILEG